MGEPVQLDYQQQHQVDSIDVEGIEIFGSESGLEEGSQPLAKTLPGLSIKEAARFLGVSPNTIRARIKSGEVMAGKVKGPTGEQWRVFVDAPDKALVQESVGSAEVSRLLDIIEKQSGLLAAQSGKLETAAGQIGYLQAQLEAGKETIKLLEDRQSVGWWRRAWNWFTGSS